MTLTLPERKEMTEKEMKAAEYRGKLKVRADKIKKTDDQVKFSVQAELKSRKFLCFRQDNPYLLIERSMKNNNKSQKMLRV